MGTYVYLVYLAIVNSHYYLPALSIRTSSRVLFTHVHYFVHLNLCIALFLAYGLFVFADFAIGKRVSSQ